jgi:hypothetical protein
MYALLRISGFRYLFFIIKLNNFFLQILLEDKYNIGVLTVNIECMWFGSKRMERLSKARLSPASKPRHIHSIFTVHTPLLYIYTISLLSL